MTLPELTEESLIEILLNSDKRAALIEVIEAESGSHLLLTNRYEELARRCQATSEQLRQAIHGLLAAQAKNVLIEPLLFHPHMPDSLLFELSDQERYSIALAHRKSPQALLEKVAAQYRQSEAITTLALDYYGADTADNQEFAEFVARYKEDYMLQWNLKRSRKLSEEKRTIALSLLEPESNQKDGAQA